MCRHTMSMSDNISLTPEQFREFRLDLFTVQRRAADAMGVAWTTLNRWERGHAPIPKWASALLLAWHASGRKRV